MAQQRRMVYAKILENENFGTMSVQAQLLYIFLIVLADDEGRVKANAVALKGRIFPFQEKISVDDIRKWLNEIVKSSLITWYKVENDYYIEHPNWYKHQKLRNDRKQDSVLPSPDDGQMADKWRTNGDVSKKVSKKESKKVRKKVSNRGIEEEKRLYLKNIPEEDMKEFYNRFDCSRKAIASKAEDLYLYCQSKNRIYSNYKAFLLNALKKDFPERKYESATIHQKSNLNSMASDIEENKGIVKSIPQGIKDQINKIIGTKTIPK